MNRRPELWITIAAATVLLIASCVLSDRAVDGLYFHGWSSEDLVHTAPLADLKAQPFQTLWWLHAFPPGLDALRAIAAWPWPATPLATLVRQTDQVLLVVWAIQYGLLCAVVWHWLRALRGPRVAWLGAVLWAASPGALSFATLLDSTQLTALLFTVLILTLWRVRDTRQTSLAPYALALLGLFFVRALVQWPMFVVCGLCLGCVGVPRTRVLKVTALLLLVGGLWGAKQYAQFGWWSSSTVAGVNLAQSIGIFDDGYFDMPGTTGSEARDDRAAVRTTRFKHGGMTNLNHDVYLERNATMLARFREGWHEATWRQLAGSYWQNLRLALAPASHYSDNAMIAALPWRAAWDAVWSDGSLVALITATMLWWGYRHRAAPRRVWIRGLGLAIPVAAVCAAAVLGEKSENMRLRFFIDPVLWVWVLSGIADAWNVASTRTRSRS